jgi:hypothetical protein
MDGLGSLVAAHEDDGSDFGASLPWTVPSGTVAFVPFVFLRRPTVLTWPGQDAANDANETVWLNLTRPQWFLLVSMVLVGFRLHNGLRRGYYDALRRKQRVAS